MNHDSPSSTTQSPTTRRDASVAARRRRILEAARALLEESGPDGFSMRKLARAADLSVTTLYNLIGSREEILQALIDDSVARMTASAPISGSRGHPLRRVAKALESMLDYMIENGSVLRPLVVANFSTGYTERLRTFDEGRQFRSFKSAVHAGLDEARAEGLFRDFVDPSFLESQLYVGLELALDRWAFGTLDDERFRLNGLCGLYVALLAFAEEPTRPVLERELRRLERKLSRL